MKRRNTSLTWAFIVSMSLHTGAYALSSYPAEGKSGMVTSGHRLASEIGAEVLRNGGNAVDAAVAVGYALAVSMPNAGNIGGGGFMVVRMADGRETMIDFREAAPLAAKRDMYLDSQGNIVDGGGVTSWSGVAIPGTVAGLEYARTKFGTQSLKPLMSPAAKLARDGYVLNQWDDVVAFGDMLVKFGQSDPYVKKYFLKADGSPYAAGERFKQPALAKTLSSIAEQGARTFYQGWIAKETVRASQAAGGILSLADFDKYRALEYKPIRCHYRGYEVVSAAPPSSGGISLCQTLNVMEGYPLSQWGHGSAASVHALIETFRYAYADRNLEIGDPRFVQNDTERLTSKAYAEQLRLQIDPDRAKTSAQVKGGTAKTKKESSETTHYSVVDRFGNAVSVTYSLGMRFGTGKVAGDTGFFLNDTMIGFTAKVGAPNAFGLVQGPANSIEPEKRSLSSMSPTVILKDGKVFMVVGAMGGPRIISGTVQTVMNVIDYGMSVKDAVDADRIHHQWLPDVVYVEGRAISPDTRRLLDSKGHQFKMDAPRAINNVVDAIVVDPQTGMMTGAHDNREPAGAAVGVR